MENAFVVFDIVYICILIMILDMQISSIFFEKNLFIVNSQIFEEVQSITFKSHI